MLPHKVLRYHKLWRRARKDKGLLFDLHMLNNYPIHYFLGDRAWRIYKKVVCSIGPKCVICMASRWALIGFIVGITVG